MMQCNAMQCKMRRTTKKMRELSNRKERAMDDTIDDTIRQRLD
jgi:hypothetical protein